jgi:hypothetical protein
MLLKVEGQRAFEVDVSVRDRGDVAHVLLGAVPIGAFGGPLKSMRILRNNDVGEQRERAGDSGHLLARSSPSR